MFMDDWAFSIAFCILYMMASFLGTQTNSAFSFYCSSLLVLNSSSNLLTFEVIVFNSRCFFSSKNVAPFFSGIALNLVGRLITFSINLELSRSAVMR